MSTRRHRIVHRTTMTYDGEAHHSLLAYEGIRDRLIYLDGASKTYAMTGWRVGWMVVPEGMIRTVERLAQNLFICPPHVSQVAALAALSPEGEAEAQANLAVYAENRRMMLERLPAKRRGASKKKPAVPPSA